MTLTQQVADIVYKYISYNRNYSSIWNYYHNLPIYFISDEYNIHFRWQQHGCSVSRELNCSHRRNVVENWLKSL